MDKEMNEGHHVVGVANGHRRAYISGRKESGEEDAGEPGDEFYAGSQFFERAGERLRAKIDDVEVW